MKSQYIEIKENGDKYYYSNKEMTVCHREDGPAFVGATGTKAWYINNNLHRIDGPAIEYANGIVEWYLNNDWLTEEVHAGRTGNVFVKKQQIVWQDMKNAPKNRTLIVGVKAEADCTVQPIGEITIDTVKAFVEENEQWPYDGFDWVSCTISGGYYKSSDLIGWIEIPVLLETK